MFTEPQTLVFSALLTLVMLLTSATLRSRMWTPEGLKVAFGNREAVPAPTAVAGRADRAARNMLENLPMFLALMLAVRVGGHSTPAVVLGANVFFWARVVYWPVYVAGVAYVRTLVWSASIVGLVMIGIAALG